MSKKNKGWISLHRKLLESGVFKSRSAIGLKIWIAILLSATHQPYKIKRSDGSEVMLKPGDFCFGQKTWSKWLKIPPRTIFNWLATFRASSQVVAEVVDNLTPSILRVKNWSEYQGQDTPLADPLADPLATNNNVLNNNRPYKASRPSKKKEIGDNPNLEAFIEKVVQERRDQGVNIRDEKAYKAKLLKEFRPEFEKAVRWVKKKKELEHLSDQSQNSHDWDKSARETVRIDTKLEGLYLPKLVAFVEKNEGFKT